VAAHPSLLLASHCPLGLESELPSPMNEPVAKPQCQLPSSKGEAVVVLRQVGSQVGCLAGLHSIVNPG
jgi:hypothetical protein